MIVLVGMVNALVAGFCGVSLIDDIVRQSISLGSCWDGACCLANLYYAVYMLRVATPAR